MTPKLKCFKCRYLSKEELWFYCNKLKHPLENGYAMKCHSDNCNNHVEKIPAKKEVRDRLSKILARLGMKNKIIKRTICEVLRDIKRNRNNPKKVDELADEATILAKKIAKKMREYKADYLEEIYRG